MQQARDFLDETEALAALLETMDPAGWDQPTRFKGWTPNDILVHLHFWNRMVDLSLTDPEAFATIAAGAAEALPKGTLRSLEQAHVSERGAALRTAWLGAARAMALRWAEVDPRQRLPWIGPEMSARSSMTARLMETWAHGQAIYDMLSQSRPESDRIRNVVVLGVNAFGWSHRVNGWEVPDPMPELHLTAPSGALWQFGGPDAANRITGSATEFAQVVTQTRNIADTDLVVEGPIATRWMKTAQCFAGPRQPPPPPGTRRPG